MKQILFLLCLFCGAMACSPANVSTNLRDSSSEETSMTTRCVDFTTGNDRQMNSLLKQFDGWKLAYVSEYTTGNKFTTTMIMCFEKPYP